MTKSQYVAAGKALKDQHDAKGQALTVIQKHQAFLGARIDQLAKWAVGGLRPEALVRWALLDLQMSPKLQECPPSQLYLGLLACAAAGLEPGNLKQHAFLVPFRDNKRNMTVCQFMLGWRGVVVQARRSREVLSIDPEVVYEADTFDIDLGSQPRVHHKPELFKPRGDIIGAYAVARMKQGNPIIEWMSRDDLERIRKVATARKSSPAWADWDDQMFRKSPVRRLAKRLPLNADYYAAQAIENSHDEGDYGGAIDILDTLTDGAASQAVRDGERAATMLGETSTDTAGGPISDEEMAAIIAKENQEHTNG